ncbi:MAG: HAMP domain-containing sensor histidine kinase [Planctomycetota bacterium]
MSLRYKIMAAVIFITVVVLTVVIAVVLVELYNLRDEYREHDRKFRQNTIDWITSNLDLIDDDHSPVTGFEFIREVIYVKGEEARGGVELIKTRRDPTDDELEAVRDLVRRAIREYAEAEELGTRVLVIDGNSFAVPDRTDLGPPAPGGFYFTLDIPSFMPHEPLQKVYIFTLIGIVAIIVVIYYVISRTVIRPLERLHRATRRVANGDYSRPVPESGREDELDTLIETFNSMMVDLGNFRKHLQVRVDEAQSHARQAEKTLVIAQRLAATGKLASGIAHEVNNPLGGMMNAARRLLREAPDDPKRVEYLNLISEGLQRVQETVKKILQFTPHKVAPQPVEIATVLRRALALASHRIEKEGTDVVVDLPAKARVFGDPFELQQVFLNLLINALDAIAETGNDGEIAIRGVPEDGLLRILIQDNGIGLRTEDISQVFDLFFTTKEVGEGTGLGLSIAHNVIQNHGGSLRLSGEPGKGAEVEIVLPLLDGGE